MTSRRCSSYAITTNRKCKKNFKFIVNGQKLCHIHANIAYKINAIQIQKYWRGYRSRSRIYKIYILLPDELQKKVVFHIRENYLIKKHHYDVICKILDNKINKEWFNNSLYNVENDNLSDLLNIFYLFNKYFDIASTDTITILYNYVMNISYNQQPDICIYNYIPQFIQKYRLIRS